MGVSSNFLNNCNIMILVMVGWILITGILYLLSLPLFKSRKAHQITYNLLKQGATTLILFNAFNISFSAGVNWKYLSSNDPYYITNLIISGCILAILFISIVIM